MKNQHLIVAEMDSAAAEPRLASMLIHPTSYRGIYLEKAPTNILPLRSAAFDSRCDHPLTFYGTVKLRLLPSAIAALTSICNVAMYRRNGYAGIPVRNSRKLRQAYTVYFIRVSKRGGQTAE